MDKKIYLERRLAIAELNKRYILMIKYKAMLLILKWKER